MYYFRPHFFIIMNTLKVVLRYVLFVMFSLVANAQNDTIASRTDTVNTSADAVSLNYLSQLEVKRKIDSLKRVELQQEIDLLKDTDKAKRVQLQQQIDQLKLQESDLVRQKKEQIELLRKSTKGYAVVGFFKDTLWLIHNKLGSFTAAERADAINRRIRKLPDLLEFNPDSLRIAQSEATFDISYDQTIIASISENDALWEDSSQFDLAKTYRIKIIEEVERYRAETNLFSIAKNIVLALLVLGLIWFIIRYIGKLFNWIANKISEQENKKIKGIKLKNYVLFDAKRQVTALLTVNKILKWSSVLLVIYLALPVLFGIFPWTRNFANTLFGYVVSPVKKILIGFWNYLPNLITIVVIVIVFRYVLKGLRFLKNEIASEKLKIGGFYPDWANPSYQIIRVLVIAFMIVVIFPYLPGSDSPVFQGISVFLGFLFTFGSAGSLSNLIAGLVLTYMRLFKIGDRVKIDDVVGDVIEKSSLVTRVRTTKNEIISIPNSKVMNSHTINYSSDADVRGLIVHTTVTIGYDVPWAKMHSALIEAAKRTEFILDDPEPFVLQTSLDDFYVSYQVNGYIREPNKQATIYSQLHQHIQDVCNEEGIEILSPHYRAARDGNMSTIPAAYLPKDYTAPSFLVKSTK